VSTRSYVGFYVIYNQCCIKTYCLLALGITFASLVVAASHAANYQVVHIHILLTTFLNKQSVRNKPAQHQTVGVEANWWEPKTLALVSTIPTIALGCGALGS
jgi:p-aminobenzoyl-glutamate transporter AbgT